MSGSMSRRKGARYENKIRNYLTSKGLEVINPNRSGYDGDDIRFVGYPWLSGECKDHKKMALPKWVAQAQAQAPEDGLGIVVHHRPRNGNPGKDFVTLTLGDFLLMLSFLGQLENNSIIDLTESNTSVLSLSKVRQYLSGINCSIAVKDDELIQLLSKEQLPLCSGVIASTRPLDLSKELDLLKVKSGFNIGFVLHRKLKSNSCSQDFVTLELDDFLLLLEGSVGKL